MKTMDLRINIGDYEVKKDSIVENMNKCNIDGGILLSSYPENKSIDWGIKPRDNKARIQNVIKRCDCDEKELYPFYFINPTQEDALDQVDWAIEAGIVGFKVICHNHFPDDKRAIPVYQKIANYKKPILFHSGVLYDGKNTSGNYNRPCNFECLLSVENLKFALAHISWPWTDECVAIYGKFNNALDRFRKLGEDYNTEMFIDMTPGTPGIYRKNAIEKLLLIGYDIENNLLFGTDNMADTYDASYVDEIVVRDNKIYDELNISTGIREKIYSKNFYKFLGIKT